MNVKVTDFVCALLNKGPKFAAQPQKEPVELVEIMDDLSIHTMNYNLTSVIIECATQVRDTVIRQDIGKNLSSHYRTGV